MGEWRATVNDREKRVALARNLAEFQAWQNKAAERGWKLPGNSPLPNAAWIAYCKRVKHTSATRHAGARLCRIGAPEGRSDE